MHFFFLSSYKYDRIAKGGMMMQRYFITQDCLAGTEIHIDDYNHKHMQKVMRYHDGDHVVCILPNHHSYIYEIYDIEKGILYQKEELDEDHELDVDITLIYGLPRNDKFELVLQKATELGVKRIVPFLSKRSIIKTNENQFSKKYDRYLRILKGASEQSYRQIIPELTPLVTLEKISQYLSDVNIVAYEEESKNKKHDGFMKALKQDYHSITIIVGPEGGFEENEIIAMQKLGIQACSLGKRILRSETAPLYMLSVIGFTRELM